MAMGSEGSSHRSNRFRKVGVIGCGASGLVAARELKREGFEVVAYERNDGIGGIWVYDPRIEEDDLLGLNPNRKVVTSSLYASLRSNLSREIMGFTDYPLIVKDGRDGRRFPGYQELQLYLTDFATDFNLMELIKLSTEVVYVGPVPKHPFITNDNGLSGGNKSNYNCDIYSTDSEQLDHDIQWLVRSCNRTVNGTSVVEEVFDAVVVCSGHHSQPRVPHIPGMHVWPGRQIHSHNYRDPDPYRDQVVIIIGNSSSGIDISLEVAEIAKEVHVSARSAGFADITKILVDHPKLQLHSMVESLEENGTVIFQDGCSVVAADSIIYCTGYSYSFPFLDTKGKVTVDDNRVGPLYQHIFPPLLAPSLSFVGIPWKVISFPFFELQSKWIACILSGKAELPSEKDMMRAVEDLYNHQEMAGLPKHYTHCIEGFQIYDWLADQCGSARIEEWRKEIFLATLSNIRSNAKTFRDSWDDQHLLEIALLDKPIGPFV